MIRNGATVERGCGRGPVAGRQRQRRRMRPTVLALEERRLLATFTVTSTADSGPGSLRYEICQANLDPGANTIDFSIGTGAQTISLVTPLPCITVPVTIDGTSQPGYSGVPLIDLDGTLAGTGADGLVLAAGSDGSTIRGLVINNFNVAGISITTSDNTVQSTYIGTNAAGTAAGSEPMPDGVLVTGADNTIGGATAAAGNVINGNGGNGVDIVGSGATGNVVEGNTVEGTTPTATTREFSIPVPDVAPDNMVPGPDGNLWFVELASGTFTGTIANISPTGQITQICTPKPVFNFVFGPDGNIWFAGRDYIGEMTEAGTLLHDYCIPSADDPAETATAINLTLGPDGNIWYTEPYVASNIIGRLTPSGQICEFPIPFDAANIITGPDGNLWFDATGENAIGRITPTGAVTIFNDPASGNITRNYRGLTSGPNGNLWLTHENNTIVEVNTAGQLVASFAVNGSPYGMTVGADGNLWYDENTANNIGQITPQGVVTEFPIPTPNSGAEAPTLGPGGNLWFAENGADQIGEIVLNGGNGVTINGASGNTIGGTTAAAGNVISGNGGAGVYVSGAAAAGNSIGQNSISDNAGSGINLGLGTSDVVNEGETVTFDASGLIYPYDTTANYSWDFGDGQTATGPTVTHAYDAGAGAYTATVTVDDGVFGNSSASVAVTAYYVPPQVLSNLTVDNVQEAASVTVPNPFSNPFANGQYTYLWHLMESSNGDTVADSTDQDLSFTPPDAGNYTFQVTDTDNVAHSTTTTVTVNVADTPPTAFLPPELWFNPCVPGAILLTGAYDPSPAVTAAGFHYAFATDGASLSGTNYANSSPSPAAMLTFATLGDHTVTARIIDKNGGYTDYTAVADVVSATVYTVEPDDRHLHGVGHHRRPALRHR